MHDPAVYANPAEFNPERFLGDNPEPDPREIVFGYGRRICEYRYFVAPLPNGRNDQTDLPSRRCFVGPGLHIAQVYLWITSAMSLAVFNIEKYVDESGNVVEPETRYTNGGIR